MKAIFKIEAPVLLAIHSYCDSFGTKLSHDINEEINHGIDENNNLYVIAKTAYVAGVIGVLSDMGHGDDLISAE